MFKDKVVVITGGAMGIGKCLCEEFRKAGAKVSTIDVLENPYFLGDVGKKEDLDAFVKKVIDDFSHVDVFIHNALPLMKGLDSCRYEEFQEALSVGITAPFYLAQQFAPYFAKDASILLITSTRARQSQQNTESYTAAKGGLSALCHGLAMSFAGKVRVNSIAPGWIETKGASYKGADCTQHPASRVGRPEDIAHMALFLASNKAAFITGEEITIDGGMHSKMIYHGDEGWTLAEKG